MSDKHKNVAKLGKYSADQLKQLEKSALKSGVKPKDLEKHIAKQISDATGGKSLGHASSKSGSKQNSATTQRLSQVTNSAKVKKR